METGNIKLTVKFFFHGTVTMARYAQNISSNLVFTAKKITEAFCPMAATAASFLHGKRLFVLSCTRSSFIIILLSQIQNACFLNLLLEAEQFESLELSPRKPSSHTSNQVLNLNSEKVSGVDVILLVL